MLLSFIADSHLVGRHICTAATVIKCSFTPFAVIIVPVIVMAMVVNNNIQRFYHYCDAARFPGFFFFHLSNDYRFLQWFLW